MDLFSKVFFNDPELAPTPLNKNCWKTFSTDRGLNSTLTGDKGTFFCVGVISGSDASNLSMSLQATRGYQQNNVIFDNYGNLLVQQPFFQFTNPIINKPIPVINGKLNADTSNTKYPISKSEPLPISFNKKDEFSNQYNYVQNPSWISSPSKRFILAQDLDALNGGTFIYYILYNPLHDKAFGDFYKSQTDLTANGGNAVVDTYIQKYCEISASKGGPDGSRQFGDTTCNCIYSMDECIDQNLGMQLNFQSPAGQAIKSKIGYSCVCPNVSSCQNVSSNNK